LGNKQYFSSKTEKKQDNDAYIDGATIACQLHKTRYSYFPNFNKQLLALDDPRRRKTYGIDELVMTGLELFLLKLGSRNAMNNERRHSKEFVANSKKLFGVTPAHLDTVQDLFEQLSTAELEDFKVALVKQLIEKKVFYNSRILGNYIVAIDATGVVSCDTDRFGCGVKHESKNGKTVFLYNVLEAKLVTESGFSISLVSEWIVNDDDKLYNKQDCELKAFKRLAPRLKKLFPRLPVCLVGDALYANAPTMEICEEMGWKYIIPLKDGSLPNLQDCLKDDPPTKHNSFTCYPPCNVEGTTVCQKFYWANDLSHKNHSLHYLQCEETVSKSKTGESETTNFVRITNLDVNAKTIKHISRGGRLRWKVENEGFNEQKNDGYALGHLFSRGNFNAFQNWYQCLQIAHMLNQLVEHSIVVHDLQKQFKKLTLTYLWQQWLRTMSCGVLCLQTLTDIGNKKHQIRLYTG
jgi:hypothetical protein